MKTYLRMALVAMMLVVLAPAALAGEGEPLHSVVTEANMIGSDSTLGIYSATDPKVDGVACHYTIPKKGGLSNDLSGMIGANVEVSDISIACRQVGPVNFQETFEQGENMLEVDRGGWFLSAKEMRIVRVCDPEFNTLVYMVYSTKLIDGSPKNSTSTVPIMPWGDTPAPSCADHME